MYVKLLSSCAKIPSRSKPGDAGYDLSSTETLVVPPWGKAIVPTGVSMALSEDTYGRVAPRSGLAAKHSIHVGAGVVDSSFRGEIKVILFNLSDEEFHVSKGDRIAQIVITKIETPDLIQVEDLPDSVRGSAGFGSSGV